MSRILDEENRGKAKGNCESESGRQLRHFLLPGLPRTARSSEEILNRKRRGRPSNFNGDVERPSLFGPSIIVRYEETLARAQELSQGKRDIWKTDYSKKASRETRACHFFMYVGKLLYCSNFCHHKYADKVIEMPTVDQWHPDFEPTVLGSFFELHTGLSNKAYGRVK